LLTLYDRLLQQISSERSYNYRPNMIKLFVNKTKKLSRSRYSKERHNLYESGFTLIELVVTMVVLGIIITSLSGMYYIMQSIAVQGQHLDIATRAARTEIEDLRNSGYNSLIPGSNIDFTASLPTTLPKNATGTVVISQPLSGLIKVDVTISYTDFGSQHNVELSSDIGVIGIGQT
jgi:prepilin-type N-terminal cleavage/methylation domain-containing protein